MDVGKRIVDLRLKKDLSTNKLANLAGISQSYLRDIELGKKQPTVEYLGYICDALKISLKDFFDEEKDKELEKSIFKLTEIQQSKLMDFLNTL
ncbi:MAG: helix-turn-helix domain-containing protein [Acutalibacteraceae bacterium]